MCNWFFLGVLSLEALFLSTLPLLKFLLHPYFENPINKVHLVGLNNLHQPNFGSIIRIFEC